MAEKPTIENQPITENQPTIQNEPKLKTYTEQLIEVQTAITDILANAQEASYNGQRVRKADLEMLQKREEWFISKVNSQNRRGIRVRGVTPC